MVSDKVFDHVINELSQEDIETLRALHGSSLWKKYREVLIRAKEAHFLGMLPEMDTNKTFQAKGMVAGINYCINQLPVILAGDALKKKREMSKHQ
jgi:hypothetical protein